MSSFILVRYQSRIEYSISQMSARRKHVRAHARDVEVEVDGENDLVCRVEEIKGGNVIEVLCTTYKHIIVFSLSPFWSPPLHWVTTFSMVSSKRGD